MINLLSTKAQTPDIMEASGSISDSQIQHIATIIGPWHHIFLFTKEADHKRGGYLDKKNIWEGELYYLPKQRFLDHVNGSNRFKVSKKDEKGKLRWLIPIEDCVYVGKCTDKAFLDKLRNEDDNVQKGLGFEIWGLENLGKFDKIRMLLGITESTKLHRSENKFDQDKDIWWN